MIKTKYTSHQGQYLAFIFYYTKIHGRAPAESDLQSYFKVSPPSVHQMILTLEAKRLIERT
ncbi:MAG: LexA family protein, partial [Pyrinomonadaceae bacterium]